MEAVRLEIELSLLQIRKSRTVDSLRAMLEKILSLEHQENTRILSVDFSPSLKEKVEALHSACLKCSGMQKELLEEEKFLSEFQISQLQGEKDHCFEGKNATKARLVSLKNQLQIASHFDKSLENMWKNAVRSLSSVKCGIKNLNASACASENLTRSYLNQRLKEKAADLARLQKNRSHLEKQKRLLPIDTSLFKVETEIKGLTHRALEEIAEDSIEKQQLKLQCRNLAERKQAKLERLERAKDELQKLKHNKGTTPSEEALEKFDKEIFALEARNLSLQQQVDKNGGYIQKMKDEIVQLESQISSENEAMQKAESARESELQFLLDEIAAAENKQILLKDQNAALKAKIEEISLNENKTDVTKLADKKAKLNDELKEMQARVEKKDGSNQTRAANIKELQQKIAALEREIDESTALREKVMTKYRSEMENLQAEIAALESDLKSLSEVSITTENSLEESKKNLTELEAVLAGKKKTQAKLQQQLEAVKKENELAVDTLNLFEESKQAEEQAKKEQAARDAKVLLPWLWGRSGAEDVNSPEKH
ncbi:cingulin-like [Cloeon dipterum]|uniref:cingulin-like n=1 Tax=Cloeon dipterum TaxID=197152 RepID=UPI00321F87A2